jgi:CDP-glucose 4,6-dehydratase
MHGYFSGAAIAGKSLEQRPGTVESLVMFDDYYQARRVLVTGHTGFKGGWLSLWLKKLGAEVWGLSLPPPTEPNLYEIIQPGTFAGEIECDIRQFEPLAAALNKTRPEIVFHLAAQPIVRHSYVAPLDTFQTNAAGTANLLESVRRAELSCSVVVITSDKCYENREWEFAYRENDPLGGHDIYSMSKAATELVVQAWRRSFFAPNPRLGALATVRAGNVIGGGDYGADRIVPDCVRALTEGKPVLVRNPSAVRPWQHVFECLSGYLLLGARLGREGRSSPLASAFNFGPEPSAQQTVRRLVEEILTSWRGEWVDGSDPKGPHEANRLSLSIEKAAALLSWYPCWDFSEAVQRSVAWYFQRHVQRDAQMLEFSSRQIDDYLEAARRKNLAWV